MYLLTFLRISPSLSFAIYRLTIIALIMFNAFLAILLGLRKYLYLALIRSTVGVEGSELSPLLYVAVSL